MSVLISDWNPKMQTTNGVYKAISAVQKQLCEAGITKDQRNKEQNYAFRGIDDVYNAVSSLLADHNLCILPRVLSRMCEVRLSSKGTNIYSVVLEVEYDFICSEDGSKHTIKTFGEAMDTGDKATNKAMSAAYKYAIIQAFSIPTKGEDNDPDAKTHDETVNDQKRVQNERNQANKQFQNAKQNTNSLEGLLKELMGIKESGQFIWYVSKELPRRNLKEEIKKALFASCLQHGKKLGLDYDKKNNTWIKHHPEFSDPTFGTN